jgi:hypothetical protein
MRIARSNLYAPKCCVTLKVRRVGLLILVLLSSSACAAQDTESPMALGAVIEGHQNYDGRVVLVDACLNVTRHTMTLVDCQNGAQEVMFEATKGVEAEYQRIIDAGFENYGNSASQVRVRLSGTFKVLEGAYLRYVLSVKDVREISGSG